MKDERKFRIRDYLPMLIMGALMLAGLFFVIFRNDITTDFLVSIMPRSFILCALILICCFAVQGVSTIILYNVILLASGMLFDLPTAIAVNAAGTIVCITGPYLVGRFSKDALVRKILSKSKKISRALDENKSVSLVLFMLFLRACGISNALLGVLFGSLRMKYIPYVLTSLIGMLPGMICFTVLGSELGIESPYFWISIAVDAVMILFCFTVYKTSERKNNT